MESFTVEQNHLITESNVFCLAPWTHIHVLTTGEVFPCCMSAHDSANAIGNLRRGDTLRSAWISEKMNALRLRMLRGERSRLCERCYRMEQVGQESWRTAENKVMVHHLSMVERTAGDGSLAELHLPYLDLRFSNICNLKCRICTPKLSSSWYSDGIRLGYNTSEEPAIISAADDRRSLMRQIEPLLATVEHLHFAGGEPLIMEEHYQIVDKLLSLKRYDVRISYNTNFSTFRYRQYDVVEMWKKFPKIYLQASLDGMGERGDYMRKGQKWDQIVKNRERLLRECPHIDFCVLATVGIMNVLHLPDFYKNWLELGYIKPKEMQLNILSEPMWYNIRGLTAALKSRVEYRYREFIDGYLSKLGEEGGHIIRHLEAVLQYMRAADLDVANSFGHVTKALDLLRNESFKDVFPELAEFLAPSVSADLWLTARTNRHLGRNQQAMADLDLLINGLVSGSIDPDGPGESRAMLLHAYIERGQMRRMQGDAQGTEQDLAKAGELAEGDLNSRPVAAEGQGTGQQNGQMEQMGNLSSLERAQLQHRQGDARGALQSYVLVAKQAPQQTVAFVSRRLMEARSALQLLPDEEYLNEADMFANPAFGYYIRGIAKSALGDRKGAEKDLDAVLSLTPLLEAAMRAKEDLSK